MAVKSTRARAGAKRGKKAAKPRRAATRTARVSLRPLTKALIDTERRLRQHELSSREKDRALKFLEGLRKRVDAFCGADEPDMVLFVPMGPAC